MAKTEKAETAVPEAAQDVQDTQGMPQDTQGQKNGPLEPFPAVDLCYDTE